MQEGLPKTAILDLLKAIYRKQCKIGGNLVLITNIKSHISFRLILNSVTLNDLARRNGPYFPSFTGFGSFRLRIT